MRFGLVLGLLLAGTVFLSTVYSANQHDADIDDNEFAEFEDFDDGKLILIQCSMIFLIFYFS